MWNESSPKVTQPLDSQIAISGAAIISCLGTDRAATWSKVQAGSCGVAPLTAIEYALPNGADGGQATELKSGDESAQPRHMRYLRQALLDALADAGMGQNTDNRGFVLPYPANRCAAVLGTTLHGMRDGGDFLRTGNHESLRGFLASSVLGAALRDVGFDGPALTTCSACSSSLSSVGLAVTLLDSGQADLVIAGGYDAISEYAYAGFNSLRLVAQGALRPFARDRQGMKVGEGYGIIVLEREGGIVRRGGRAIARILGVGESADAHHLTQPHPEGEGAFAAIVHALESAGLTPRDIDLLAAHATGTPDNDAAEYAALRRVFGEALPRLPVVAFKSHLSHALGGAGALELILSAMALESQVIPPCANVSAKDTDFAGLALTSGSAKPAPLKTSMNLSLGFGGANTCVILGKDRSAKRTDAVQREVWITGVGVMLPGAIGNEAFLNLLSDGASRPVQHDATELDETALGQLLSARRIRRMSAYVKLSLAAAMLALKDANVPEPKEFCRSASAVLGTTHAAAQYCAEYYTQIVRDGIAAANPLLFAEGVPNAAAAHLSLATGMKGACQTLIGSRTSGLDALGLAAMRIASGQWDRAIVAAADEYSPMVNSACAHCGLYAPHEPAAPFAEKAGTFVAGWGAAALVLEARPSLDQRHGARIRGQMLKYAARTAGEGNHVRLADEVLAELSDPPVVMSSANGTWLDRVEADALRLSSRRTRRDAAVSSLCGYFPECFSAGPLAGIAAVLLRGGLPPLLGASRSNAQPTGAAMFAALATDYHGSIAGVNIGAYHK